uniref:Uncharacterized protein n=1 Tax=Oryza glaberrima TaxID=4538 RepID=I1Q7Z9_ORYGL
MEEEDVRRRGGDGDGNQQHMRWRLLEISSGRTVATGGAKLWIFNNCDARGVQQRGSAGAKRGGKEKDGDTEGEILKINQNFDFLPYFQNAH